MTGFRIFVIAFVLLASTAHGRATPLHDAAVAGDVAAVETLLAAGADVNARIRGGTTPLHRAARNGHVAAVEALLAAGAEVNVQDLLGTPLHQAAMGGHDLVVVALLAAGAEVYPDHSTDDTDREVLAVPAQEGYLAVIELLLAAGADVNHTSGDWSSLELAAENGHLDVVEALLAAGADVRYGTPLRRAISRGARHSRETTRGRRGVYEC